MSPAPPLLGEPLPIELANTCFVRRGEQLDGLRSPRELAEWLERVGDRLPLVLTPREQTDVDADNLAAARALRDALRVLLAARTSSAAFDPAAVDILNRTARAAPRWRELAVEPRLAVVTATAAAPVRAVLAALADEAMDLLAGEDADALRACAAPGCSLFYRKDHPRRAWCSPRCSNRVRAARHYARRTGKAPAAER